MLREIPQFSGKFERGSGKGPIFATPVPAPAPCLPPSSGARCGACTSGHAFGPRRDNPMHNF